MGLCIVCLLLLVVGCGEQETDTRRITANPGITDDEVVVGASLALSGSASYIGVQVLSGARAYLEAVNQAGGVHGRRIRLVALDDGYDPPRCVANTQKLIIDHGVFAFLGYVGTPTTVKVLPLVLEAGVPLVAPLTGAAALREERYAPYVVNLRGSYYEETKRLVEYFVQERGLSRVAIFYQFDAFGFDGLSGTELALRGYGLSPVARGSYHRGTMDVEDAVARIAESQPQAVVMIGTAEPLAKFYSLMSANSPDVHFGTVSFAGAEKVTDLLGSSLVAPFVMSQVVRPPGLSAQDASARLYVDLLAKSSPSSVPDAVGFEGFLAAKALVDGLRLAGPKPTRTLFLEALGSRQPGHFSEVQVPNLHYGPVTLVRLIPQGMILAADPDPHFFEERRP